MEKLELKHLAPYLPYKVEVKLESKLYPKCKIVGVVRNTIYLNYHGHSLSLQISDVKPILRPLSDNWHLQFEVRRLDAWERLFKGHFDVFGLIEKGLAIDINTIKE